MDSPNNFSLRTSGRKRKLNVKYSNDAFEGLEALSDSEQTPTDSLLVADDGDDDDDDFGPEDGAAGNDDEEEQDGLSIGSDSEGAASATGEDNVEYRQLSHGDTGASSKTPVTKPGERDIFNIATIRHAARAMPKVIRGQEKLSAEGVRDRGVRQVNKRSSRDANLIYTFGSQKDDIIPLLQAKSKWFDELTIPSRLTNASGKGGMGYSFYQKEEQRQEERMEGWRWYYEQGGRVAFEKRQGVRYLSHDEAKPYMRNGICQFVAGKLPRQSLFTLDAGHTVNLGQAWPGTGRGGSNGRSGWIINAGESAETLDWAPNREDGLQYLAIGGSPRRPRPTGDVAFKAASTPAFTPAPPTPSSIQIWEFASTPSAGETITISPITAPLLRALICIDWGPVKTFKWAPFFRQVPLNEPQDSSLTHLGLLAVLSGDGALRVLDIHIPTTSTATPTPTYLHITSTAFTTRPPDTLVTCLTWVTPQVLATGCANGFLAAFNLTAHLLAANPPPTAHPAIYTPIHTTYILSIASCLPSRPAHILTSSLDGHHRLTSLHAPTTDAVLTPRARIGHAALLWLDAVQHVLTADDAYNVSVHNVRRIHTTSLLLRQAAPVSVLAASRVHASVLVGGADGEVCVVNPVRKALHATKAQGLWKQVWFAHLWRRGGRVGGGGSPGTDGVAASGGGFENGRARDGDDEVVMQDASSDRGLVEEEGESPPSPTSRHPASQQHDKGNGLARLTSGFALEQVQRLKVRTPGSTNTIPWEPPAGVISTTIYEEKSGVKSLAWNQNLKAGGWAAAGLGTGLVWVEDIAWDG